MQFDKSSDERKFFENSENTEFQSENIITDLYNVTEKSTENIQAVENSYHENNFSLSFAKEHCSRVRDNFYSSNPTGFCPVADSNLGTSNLVQQNDLTTFQATNVQDSKIQAFDESASETQLSSFENNSCFSRQQNTFLSAINVGNVTNTSFAYLVQNKPASVAQNLLAGPKLRGRPPLKKVAEIAELHSNCEKRYAKLQKEFDEAIKKNNELKARVACFEAADENLFASKSESLIALLKRLDLPIRGQAIKAALLRSAQNENEAADAVNHFLFIDNAMKKIRKDQRAAVVAMTKNSLRCMRQRWSAKDREENCNEDLATVFGKLTLRKASATMRFHCNTLFSFAGTKIICGHADGRFTATPGKWKQTFELRLVLEHQGKRKTVTFAMALLQGSKQENYQEFFTAAKAHGCPNLPFLITDFEVAISNAAKSIWPQMNTRGCLFHYMQNIQRYARALKRWTGESPSLATMNFLRVAPFLHELSVYFYQVINQVRQNFPEDYNRNTNYKMLAYAHSTYAVRFKHMFSIDLSHLTIRTNNTCEGSNSALSKAFPTKPTAKEFAEFVADRFKVDIASDWKQKPTETIHDKFALQIQKLSSEHVSEILNFCSFVKEINNKNTSLQSEVLRGMQLQVKRPMSVWESEQSKYFIRLWISEFRRFTEVKRIEKRKLQLSLRLALHDGHEASDACKMRPRNSEFLISDDSEADIKPFADTKSSIRRTAKTNNYPGKS
ncbi:MAG: hypothetical protein ACRYGG_22750 [Janthinobacterium lividum]